MYRLAPFFPMLDLGRPLTQQDIVCDETFAIEEHLPAGICYLCEPRHFPGGDMPMLTASTGVFTRLVRCEAGIPVWVCLEHLPHQRDQFEAFSPEVAKQLRQLQAQRDAAVEGGR